MNAEHDNKPVLIIDGSQFTDFEGFAREFTRLLNNYPWRGNLDAFNDILWGGFGTPEGVWVLRWIHSEASRAVLGHDATARRLEGLLLTCHPANRSEIGARLAMAREGQGPTLFDEIFEIVQGHEPEDPKSDHGILLELL